MGNDLPAPCERCSSDGGYWIEINGGRTRCRCARGLRLAQRSLRPVLPSRADPVLTADEISAAVEGLSAMPYFPPAEMARTMVGDAIGLLCVDGGSCFELVRNMIAMYRQWPGVREMRICYCALVGAPLSGEDMSTTISEFYPDGFRPLAPAAPNRVMLPPGHAVSADPELDAAVQQAAKHLGMRR